MQIRQLKQNALIVRLQMREQTTEQLRQAGNAEAATKLQLEQEKKNKEKSHARDTLQEKAQLEKYLLETAKILWKYTEPEKLNDFENNEKLSRLNQPRGKK